jgi:hypothetical protein
MNEAVPDPTTPAPPPEWVALADAPGWIERVFDIPAKPMWIPLVLAVRDYRAVRERRAPRHCLFGVVERTQRGRRMLPSGLARDNEHRVYVSDWTKADPENELGVTGTVTGWPGMRCPVALLWTDVERWVRPRFDDPKRREIAALYDRRRTRQEAEAELVRCGLMTRTWADWGFQNGYDETLVDMRLEALRDPAVAEALQQVDWTDGIVARTGIAAERLADDLANDCGWQDEGVIIQCAADGKRRRLGKRAAITAEDMADPTTDAVATAPDPAPPYRTGGQGRPTSIQLIAPELERRRLAGKVLGTSTAEAQALSEWLGEVHPEASPTTAKTIRNSLRDKLRAAVEETNAAQKERPK